MGESRNNCAIGVFDSGVGGTTVLKKLRALLPSENYVYFADSYNAPYGEKSMEDITSLCLKIGDFLTEQGCKIIVIACNTATAAALNAMTEKYTVPVFGIVSSGAKLAVESTKNKNVGVLATPFTVSTSIYQKEIQKIDSSIDVYQVGCKEFCPMIESIWSTHDNRLDIVRQYTSQLEDKNIDTLVLGCTHYPIITEDIRKCLNTNIVDPADYMSKEIKDYLTNNKLLNDSKECGKTIYHTSGSVDTFKKIVGSFFKSDVDNFTNQSIDNVVNTRLSNDRK